MNPVILIPTYVSARRLTGSDPILTSYDHTTPLSLKGELPRCLNSLRTVRGVGRIIVLVVSERACAKQASEKVRQIAERFPDLDISVVGAAEMAIIHQRLEQLGAPSKKEINLTSYGAIRNVGMLLANVFNFDSLVFIDDDVVIDDPAFLEKAMYGLGKHTRRGVPILAKTGFYFNADNQYTAPHDTKWYNRFWSQTEFFNEWITQAMKSARLTRSNYVCGGCMALHHEAFTRVSFDPWITRGEDLDYMINLRMYSGDMWFDNKWYMRHLPPTESVLSEGMRFRQDIFRWLYEFRKLEYGRTQIDLHPVKPASLQPYPGPFLDAGVQKRIKRTARLRSFGCPDGRGYRRAAQAATGDALRYAEENCSRYFEFQYKWPTIMSRISNDPVLQQALAGIAVQAPQRVAQMRSQMPNLDPGVTTEIRLNLGDRD